MTWKFPTFHPNSEIDWSLVEDTFNWFADLKGVPQDPKWHAEGDVFIHTKLVVDSLISLPEFKEEKDLDQNILYASALLHDIEKRSTTTTETIDGVTSIISPKHSKRGEATTRELLYKEIPTPFIVREKIAKLVRHHGLPLWVIDKENPQKEVIKVSLVLNTRHLYILAKADVLGRECIDKEDVLLKIELFKTLCEENNCFGKNRLFNSNLARYLYLNKPEMALEYEPFDNLEYSVYMMSALPGTGKDTYINKNLDYPVLSLDEIRRENRISPTDKKGNGKVIQLGKEKAKEFLRQKQSFVFNATNLTRDIRNKWTSLFNDYKARIKIIYLEVPYNQLLTQNQNRDYSVPNHVVDKLIKKWQIPEYEEAHEIEYITESDI